MTPSHVQCMIGDTLSIAVTGKKGETATD